MNHLNEVYIIGKITQDIKINTAGNSQVAKINLLVQRELKKQDGSTYTESFYIDVDAWGKLAQVAQNYKKDSEIFVKGRLKFNSWQDKEGNKRNKYVIMAETLESPEKIAQGEISQPRTIKPNPTPIITPTRPSNPIRNKPVEEIDDLPF